MVSEILGTVNYNWEKEFNTASNNIIAATLCSHEQDTKTVGDPQKFVPVEQQQTISTTKTVNDPKKNK